jgi:hypothetical protein
VRLTSLCNKCLQPFQILLEAGDAALIRQISLEDAGRLCKCPRLCGGKINLVGDPMIAEMGDKLREPMTLTGKELYAAVNGLGLPDEVEKDPEVIRSLLVANKVVAVDIEVVLGRLYLHELKLDNGFTIHLASGARGSQVLKVTKERKPCPSP